MKCKNISCGREIEDGSKFCPYCGTPQRSVLPMTGGGGRRTSERHSDVPHPLLDIAAIIAAVFAFTVIVVSISSSKNDFRKIARAERKAERIERRIRRTERRIGEYERLDPYKFDNVLDIPGGGLTSGPMKLSSSPQGAKIYIDGKYTGRKTPAQVDVYEGEMIEIKYGNYTLIVNAGNPSGTVMQSYFADFSPLIKRTGRINAKAGHKYDWVDGWLHDSSSIGNVEVTSDPPGAKIYLDGEYIGMKTPSRVNVVGTEKLEVKYKKWVSTKEIFPETYKGFEKFHVDYTPLM